MNCYVCHGEAKSDKYVCDLCSSVLMKQKSRAHQSVGRAVKSGALPQLRDGTIPCVDCGDEAECYDHRDYRLPLDVQAVCERCDSRRGMGEPYRSMMVQYLQKAPLDGPRPAGHVIKSAGYPLPPKAE